MIIRHIWGGLWLAVSFSAAFVSAPAAAQPTRAMAPGNASIIDHWTGESFTGGRHLRVQAPLEKIPLYVRAGALIPTMPVRDTVGDEQGTGPRWHLAPASADGYVVRHPPGY